MYMNSNEKIYIIIILTLFYIYFSKKCKYSETFSNNTVLSDQVVPHLKILTNISELMQNGLEKEELIISKSLNLLPRGIIMTFYGEHIPEGWTLCDGNNGTPNLIGNFILGDDRLSPLIGQSKHINLKQLPSHTHTGETDKDVFHNHYTGIEDIFSEKNDLTYRAGGGMVIYENEKKEKNLDITDNDGNHQHKFRTEETGKGNLIGLPPYMTLKYIMKL